jgi:hypothetical protein
MVLADVFQDRLGEPVHRTILYAAHLRSAKARADYRAGAGRRGT